MAISKQEFAQYIRQFQFRELFNDMGWNNDRTSQPIVVDNITFQLQAVAEKSGFKILLCPPDEHGKIPDYSLRKKIETKVTRLFQEHLIIFVDAAKKEQVWQLVTRQSGKPAKLSETRYHISQDPELLYQRASGVFFELDEEEKITIVDVTRRIADNFSANAEKVTKKFYEGFKREHTAFLDFIKGIDAVADREWYASLMLNRLMFIYFIQKKGFLNDDRDYLRNKLNESQEKSGKDRFYSFYRSFLLVLFHDGLGAPDHSAVQKEIGRVPYLNGGLFEVHQIESSYNDIQIDDAAFNRIFDFFDQYEWHLDTRLQATGKEINPDVIGYIFEKYINDRAAMGAYYTKEDITDYIGKNCIIPFLFDELKREYPAAFKTTPHPFDAVRPEHVEGLNGSQGRLNPLPLRGEEIKSEVWGLLQANPNAYIYDAVKHGIKSPLAPLLQSGGIEDPPLAKGDSGGFAEQTLPLPEDIAAGLNDVSKRTNWNKPAPAEYALPTETWREVVERRRRYEEIKGKIEQGGITEINDLITYNLNIIKFAVDIIYNSADPELIKHLYKAISRITVLDPTCGSGAFLFAALNILELLYEACLQRMEHFVNEAPKGKFKFFEETLDKVKAPEHPNLQYFIFKSIILNNLYGVDIMKEATEIAKLRLFLKLVATVEVDYRKPNMGLEPLPDIDFNIRAGNTLVGFVSIEDVKKSVAGTLHEKFLEKEIGSIEEAAEYVKMAYQAFRKAHLENDPTLKDAKQVLNDKLQKLNEKLNSYLAILYGKDAEKNPKEYKAWLESHKPFHWFSEFYEIIHDRGGFDVIIGNPPYVEYSKVKKDYIIKGYATEGCGNLYAFVMERSTKLNSQKGRSGLIVPMSITSIREYVPLRKYIEIEYQKVWTTNHAIRPTSLFTGISQRVTIVLSARNGNRNFFSTNYLRTFSPYYLFQSCSYVEKDRSLAIDELMPKLSREIEINIFRKMRSFKPISEIDFSKTSKSEMFFKDYGETYWIFPFNFTPWLTPVKSYNSLKFNNKTLMDCAVAYFNSSLFYWFYSAISDCWHFGKWHITKATIGYDRMDAGIKSSLERLTNELMTDFCRNRNVRYDSRIAGDLYEYKVSNSKPIIDEIDRVLARHYGFTDEELDFIINYDIKYRMGKAAEGEEEE